MRPADRAPAAGERAPHRIVSRGGGILAPVMLYRTTKQNPLFPLMRFDDIIEIFKRYDWQFFAGDCAVPAASTMLLMPPSFC